MKQFFVLTVTAVALLQAQPQNRAQSDPAYPVIGWDSLKSMIVYPEIARRAGVQGYANVSADIDEAGKIVSVVVSGHGIFKSNIEDVVKKVQWKPEMNNGKAVKSSVVFEIQYQIKNIQDMPKKRVLVIESENPNAMK